MLVENICATPTYDVHTDGVQSSFFASLWRLIMATDRRIVTALKKVGSVNVKVLSAYKPRRKAKALAVLE